MEAIYASAFISKYVWCDSETLKYRLNLSEFHRQFLNLAKLVGETEHTATFGSRLYDIYAAKMLDSELQILNSVIVTAHQTGRMLHLHDAMNVVDKFYLLRRGRGSALGSSSSSTATTLASGPMKLGVISQTNACARCSGRGHWSYFCATPKDWKDGDLMKKPDFDKTKRKGKDKREKGRGIHGQNNATETEVAMEEGAAEGG
jgi:hypothetical protein